MKRRLILLVVVIALIAGFGALLHSPPSIIDAVTGATPKAKKAAQSSAQLEGSYIFCMNPLLDKLSVLKSKTFQCIYMKMFLQSALAETVIKIPVI